MRVLLINYEYPPLGGGAGNATRHLARELAGLGHEPLVLTSAFKRLSRKERVDGVIIHRVPALRRREDRSNPVEMLSFMIGGSLAALRLAWQKRPEAAVAFFGLPGGPIAWGLKRVLGLPYVVSLRGGDVPGFEPEALARYHRLAGGVIRRLWRSADAVVANSHGLAALARKSAPWLSVEVIPNGVDPARFAPRFLPRDWGEPRFGFAGRLVRQKGVDVLLQALARLPRETNVHLEIVGDGPERPALEAQAEALGLSDRVFFKGWLPSSRMPAFYQRIDLLVLPSREEGMPNVVLEAMAAGLPVMATRVAGTEELVLAGGTGWLTRPGDPDALAVCLAQAAADAGQRERLGRAGRERVEASYTWRHAAEAYAALLERVVRPLENFGCRQNSVSGFGSKSSK